MGRIYRKKNPDHALERVCGLPPIICQDSLVLILGTLPGPISLKLKKYYCDPRNGFWRILFEACGKSATKIAGEEKDALLKEYKIALWDVLKSALRVTGGDNGLSDEWQNDLPTLLLDYPNIKLLIFHSKAAYKYFHKFFKNPAVPYICVASPSGRNKKRIEEKVSEWRAALSSTIPQLQTEHRFECNK